MSREEMILRIAEQLKEQIMSNPQMCCFGEDESGRVGFDGYIDLKRLAEWIYVRLG